MEPDYAKLLFATEMHKLAIELYKNERRAFVSKISDDEDTADSRLDEWKKENRIDKYVAMAYKEIKGTLKQVEEIVEAERSAELDDAIKGIAGI